MYGHTGSASDGIGDANELITQHSQVQQYEGRALTRTFRLAAGVTYTAEMRLVNGGGSWTYHTGAGYLWLEGKAWYQ